MQIRHIATVFALSFATLQAQTPALPAIKALPPSVPYVYRNVIIRAGGFVSGIVFSPGQRDLVYARTDVGGAYRSDDDGNHWIPLTDQFGPRDATYTGIESIATDPSDPNKLYIAAGLYTNQWGGPSAIFRSTDKGRTLFKTPMPFKMGGNEDGRGVGERLAVDPNLGSTLYFGSRLNGLWRSADSGVTWQHVDSFPAAAQLSGPGAKTGITFVLFDPSTSAKGVATKTIYAGVAQSTAGLYRSDDAGQTWQLIPNAPKNLFPTHAALDPGKTLYLTYNDGSGPNGIQAGAIYKLSLGDNKWRDISPIPPNTTTTGHKFGYGGISLDAEHPDTLIVTTLDRWYPTDAIFRSTTGGRQWTQVSPNAIYSARETPWVYWHKDKIGGTGWMQSIAIDPFHPNHVLYGTGEGIYGTTDITNADTNKPTHWSFPNDGLEELVPDMVISPPDGAHLLSAVGDLGGFRHEDVTQSPAQGIFTNPQLTSGSAIDFAALIPDIIVRVGYGSDYNKVIRGAYSLDDGITWKPFASEPPSSHRGGGRIAISADGKTVVWSPDGGAPFLTTNWGATWAPCSGLTDKMRVVADRVNPLAFYSFNPETGQLLVSSNGAQNFTPRPSSIPRSYHGVDLAPTPGIPGDLWIAAADKLFHTTDSGATFATLEGLSAVHRLGFGKAAPGETTPAIYLTGIIQDTEGLFRSTDAGQSWLRIDDPAHQFGWKNSITGDPRIFGRVYFATGGRGILYGDPAIAAAITTSVRRYRHLQHLHHVGKVHPIVRLVAIPKTLKVPYTLLVMALLHTEILHLPAGFHRLELQPHVHSRHQELIRPQRRHHRAPIRRRRALCLCPSGPAKLPETPTRLHPPLRKAHRLRGHARILGNPLHFALKVQFRHHAVHLFYQVIRRCEGRNCLRIHPVRAQRRIRVPRRIHPERGKPYPLVPHHIEQIPRIFRRIPTLRH